MIQSADWLCERHFGRNLIDRGVDILDPATGTETFVCELPEHFSGQKQKLEFKYEHELHANEVAILPYYVANLNIEATYAGISGEYREFPGLCFVDTLDNTAGLRRRAGHVDDMFGAVTEARAAPSTASGRRSQRSSTKSALSTSAATCVPSRGYRAPRTTCSAYRPAWRSVSSLGRQNRRAAASDWRCNAKAVRSSRVRGIRTSLADQNIAICMQGGQGLRSRRARQRDDLDGDPRIRMGRLSSRKCAHRRDAIARIAAEPVLVDTPNAALRGVT